MGGTIRTVKVCKNIKNQSGVHQRRSDAASCQTMTGKDEDMKPVVIIPVLNPEIGLVMLIEKLTQKGLKTVLVDDGSDKNIEIFDMLLENFQCRLCRHGENRGKGAALKTGMAYGAAIYPETCGFITADADGQHTADDIESVADAVEHNHNSVVLGVRNFGGKGIPIKSMAGNRITSLVYLLSTGKWCQDTQTGLRGFPSKYKKLCLETPGERYEYEHSSYLGQDHCRYRSISAQLPN